MDFHGPGWAGITPYGIAMNLDDPQPITGICDDVVMNLHGPLLTAEVV